MTLTIVSLIYRDFTNLISLHKKGNAALTYTSQTALVFGPNMNLLRKNKRH